MAISQITVIGYIAPVLVKLFQVDYWYRVTLDMNNFLKVLVKFLFLIVISVVLYPEGFQHMACSLNLSLDWYVSPGT